MKKGFFLMAFVAFMLMLTGCGDGGSSSSGISGSQEDTGARATVEVEETVSEEEAVVTTPRNLFGISETLGTPPALPAQ